MVVNYSRSLIFPEQHFVDRLHENSPIGAAREGLSLAKRVFSPKYSDALFSEGLKGAGLQSMLITASLALFIIAIVGATGHCSPNLLGGMLVAVGGSTLIINGAMEIRHLNSRNPILKAMTCQILTEAAIFGVTSLALGISMLSGSTSAVLGSKIALGTCIGAHLMALLVNKYALPKLEFVRKANEDLSYEMTSSFFQLPLEALNYFVRHPEIVGYPQRKTFALNMIVFAVLASNYFKTDYVNYIIRKLQERSIDPTTSAVEKISVDETLALVQGLKTLKDGGVIDLEELKQPLLEVRRSIKTTRFLFKPKPADSPTFWNDVLDPYFTAVNFTAAELQL